MAAELAPPPPPFVVDAHCHTFNASDLSKVGFLTEVVLDSDESIVRRLVEPLVVLLVKLIATAPGFQEEIEHLDAMQAETAAHAKTALVAAAADRRAGIDAEHWNRVAHELRRIARSSDGQEQTLFEAIVDEVHPGGTRALALGAEVATPASLTQRIAFSTGPFARYIKWVGRLKHFRADIIRELIQTYGGEPDGVRLFASAQVDFELWLRDKPQTPIAQQIELGERLSLAFPGRIHFFAPFDPWRDSATAASAGDALTLVQQAVVERGFLGVKLYPPMGFAASGNAELDFSAVGQHDSKAFGRKLDGSLDRLFDWALEHDVPIMAHCNFSEESKHGFARRASPEFWRAALAKHSGLRVNLGHFGGQDNLGPGGVNEAAGWPETIMSLMATADGARVYTDIGNFDLHDRPERTAWLATLQKALGQNPVLLSRLMYGSDWLLLATSDDYEDFLMQFRDGLGGMGTLSPAQIDAVVGGNARDFLGLNPGDKARGRLEAFYDTNGLTRPFWLGD